MHIGVDAWNLVDDRRGVGRYVRQIVRSWRARVTDAPKITLIVPERFAALAAAKYRRAIGDERIAVRSRNDVPRLGLDALWYPWNGMSWSAPGVKVATLHDASLFAMPPTDSAVAAREQHIFIEAARAAARIITDSEFSKRELVKYLTLDANRVDVVHLGADETLARAARNSERPSWLRADPYVLFVGVPEPRKGLDRLTEAIGQLPAVLRAHISLVVVGSQADTHDRQAAPDIDVHHRGHVDDRELAALYAHAAIFVYPSTYEGFGLPVLEAMACGAPVIASDASGIPEAAGDAALLVPPGDTAALSGAIRSLLEDPARADQLRTAGFARAAAMTWDETAERTLGVLERAAASGG
jgi:glycosyltransferase involved in cell wall biosynthesis